MGLFRLPRRRQLNVGAKLTTACISIAGSVYLALAGAKIINGVRAAEVAAIAVAAAVSLVASVRATYFEARKPSMEKRDVSVRQALEGAWFSIADKTGADLRDLLVSCFLLEGRGKRRYLKRLMRVGAKQIPQSNVRWERGKGVIGKCWETEATTRNDLSDLNRRYGKCELADWERVEPDKRLGMSYDDWVKTRRKYDAIVAVPLHENNFFAGCVAVTGSKLPAKWWQAPEVEQALVAAAATIAGMS